MALLLTLLLTFGYYSKNFQLDASSDTLLLENDPDLKYLREVNNKYGTKDFLVLTYSHQPQEEYDFKSENTIKNIGLLKNSLENLDWVDSVITILDIPLLDSSDEPLMDRIKNYRTLKDENIDRKRGFNEIASSPVFKNFVISEDKTTTGIIVNIKSTETNAKKFQSKKELQTYKDKLKEKNHNNIY